jgi:acetate kinase
VAVFDTALHRDIPDYAYIYAIPYKYYEKYGIRKYGFHGISFKYMTDEGPKLAGKRAEELRIVSLMLGSGCTANAMKYGKSIGVSTGFTPLEGLIQSTRSGDVDPAAVTYIMKKEGMSPEEAEYMLNQESGWLGISGVSSDFREIIDKLGESCRSRLALQAAAYRAKKYVGAYAAAMGGIDMLIFSGGAGENGAVLRKEICSGLGFLGIDIDEGLNNNIKGQGIISSPASGVIAAVVKTDEELVIARDTYRIVSGALR